MIRKIYHIEGKYLSSEKSLERVEKKVELLHIYFI